MAESRGAKKSKNQRSVTVNVPADSPIGNRLRSTEGKGKKIDERGEEQPFLVYPNLLPGTGDGTNNDDVLNDQGKRHRGTNTPESARVEKADRQQIEFRNNYYAKRLTSRNSAWNFAKTSQSR